MKTNQTQARLRGITANNEGNLQGVLDSIDND